jgi:hypothetical protein
MEIGKHEEHRGWGWRRPEAEQDVRQDTWRERTRPSLPALYYTGDAWYASLAPADKGTRTQYAGGHSLFLLGGEGDTVANSQGSSPDVEGAGPGPKRQPGEVDVEVSDLLHEPTLRPTGGRGVVPWYRQSVTVPRPAAAVALVILLVLVLLVALPGLGGELVAFVHPTPTPHLIVTVRTPAPTPTVTPFPTPTLVAPPIGPVPADCARSSTGPQVGVLSPTEGVSAVGGPSVWVDGFVVSSPATISIAYDMNGAYSAWGWPVYTALAFKDPFTAVVTLTGSDVRTGAPLWWSFSNAPPAPSFTIDPQKQGHSGGSGALWWTGTLYLPGSGCYVLSTSWPGGGWTVHFAAGH